MPIEDPLWPRADQWLASAAARPLLSVSGAPTSSASLSPSQAHLGPARIRQALGRLSSFDEETGIDLRTLPVADTGDWPIATLDAEGVNETVERHASAVLGRAQVHAILGGDNAITRPIVRGLAGGDLSSIGVLTLDAHHDVRTLDRGPTNGTPIRGLVEDGLPGANVTQVGILAFANSREYAAYCREHGIVVHTMADVERRGIQVVIAQALARLADRCQRIFVDVDVDVLDRAFAPACPGARPGGMNPRQLFEAARICGRYPKVMAADFVEVDPERDVNDTTLLNVATAFLSFAAGVAARFGDGPQAHR
jgi:formiminoglutamase